MHHTRARGVQEKNKLIVDLKRLKNHYSNFEPMLQMMRAKYETAMKEKMLMKLERVCHRRASNTQRPSCAGVLLLP